MTEEANVELTRVNKQSRPKTPRVSSPKVATSSDTILSIDTLRYMLNYIKLPASIKHTKKFPTEVCKAGLSHSKLNTTAYEAPILSA